MIEKPARLFPLVRQLSVPVSRMLMGLPLTPNQITALSAAAGLWACWLVASGDFVLTVWGGVLFCAGYVLDNCDGEIARAKNLGTAFGARFDTFVDWVVHAAFFLALGYGTMTQTGETLWIWLGVVAAAGGTINYVLGLCLETGADSSDRAAYDEPETLKDHLIYVFRELFRADFCFIVLLLAAAGSAWLLLPAAAIGSQAYWITLLLSRDKTYHV